MNTLLLIALLGQICESTWAADSSNIGITVSDGHNAKSIILVVTDPQGRQTGPSSGDIPNSSYGIEAVGNEETGASGDAWIEFYQLTPSAGKYTVAVSAMKDSSYLLSTRSYDFAGKTTVLPDVQGSLLGGTSQQLTLQYDPTPGKVPVLVKIVDFSTMIQELSAESNLSQIGGKRFVAELRDLLTDGQKALAQEYRERERARPDEDSHRDAIAKLREFIYRVEAAARTKMDDHDRDGDDKRFATAAAAQSLTSDANTLIQQLGGAPHRDHDEHHKDDH